MKKFLFYLPILGSLTSTIPCLAMEDKEDESLKTVMGKTLPELQGLYETASYNFMSQTLGNMLDVIDGVLSVSCPSDDHEEEVDKTYKFLNKKTRNRYRITEESNDNAPIIEASESVEESYAIFTPQGSIAFRSSKFFFDTCFINIESSKTITIYPDAFLKSPIKIWDTFKKGKPRRTWTTPKICSNFIFNGRRIFSLYFFFKKF